LIDNAAEVAKKYATKQWQTTANPIQISRTAGTGEFLAEDAADRAEAQTIDDRISGDYEARFPDRQRYQTRESTSDDGRPIPETGAPQAAAPPVTELRQAILPEKILQNETVQAARVERFEKASADELARRASGEGGRPETAPATRQAEVATGGVQGRSFLVTSDAGRRDFEAGIRRTNLEHPYGAAVEVKPSSCSTGADGA
jgi:hypothetical protein